MKVELTSFAKKQLKKIPKRETIKIARRMLSLRQDPYLGKKLDGKLSYLYSLRAWPYRILYSINKQKTILTIETIEHRQSAYK